MTHPTIEAAAKAFWKVPNLLDSDDDMIAAARVILSAPVSDAEVEAALVANYGKAWAKFTNGSKMAANTMTSRGRHDRSFYKARRRI